MYIICNKISSFIKNWNRHTTIPIFLVPRFKSVYIHICQWNTLQSKILIIKKRAIWFWNVIIEEEKLEQRGIAGGLRNWKMSTYPTSHIAFLTCISMYNVHIDKKKFFLKKQRYRLHNVIGTILLQYVYCLVVVLTTY